MLKNVYLEMGFTNKHSRKDHHTFLHWEWKKAIMKFAFMAAINNYKIEKQTSLANWQSEYFGISVKKM